MSTRTSKFSSFLAVVATTSVGAAHAATDSTGQSSSASPDSDSVAAATWVAPTLLVTPAGALPLYSVRATLGADAQSPNGAADRVRPLFAGEVGLGKGFTVGAGTQWIGGDAGSGADGLSPYAQLRLQVFGATDGEGWVGGVAVRYKQVGFGGGEKETEASFATRYRNERVEVGLEGVFGQSMTDGGEHDVEARAYGVLRPIQLLALGVAGQARTSVGEKDADSPARSWDLTGGGIASAIVGTMQLAVMAGATTVNLASGVGAMGEAFAAYRF